MEYEGVKCTVTMSRTLYVPKGNTNDDTINAAKQEIVLPTEIMNEINKVLHNARIRINGLDLDDWIVDNLQYNIVSNGN